MTVLSARALGIVAASGVLAAAAILPAHAASTSDYVALGDSYAAGVGAGGYLDDGSDCGRSAASYPGVLATARGYVLDLQACSGAVTSDIPRQLGTLSASTTRVSLSVGGNDIGFAPVVTECLKPSWWGNCTGAVDGARAAITDQLPGRLRTTYGLVRAKAPNATVVVTGYPRLFNGRDCSPLTFFSADEMARLNATADLLNATIRREAERAGFQFVDVTDPFVGHAVCDSPEWIHNASLVVRDSFHPKPAGHRAYATAIGSRLDGAPARQAATIRTGGQTSSDTRRGRVLQPDLTSGEARHAARRAGISDDEVRALSRARAKVEQGRSDTLDRAELDAVRRSKA